MIVWLEAQIQSDRFPSATFRLRRMTGLQSLCITCFVHINRKTTLKPLWTSGKQVGPGLIYGILDEN